MAATDTRTDTGTEDRLIEPKMQRHKKTNRKSTVRYEKRQNIERTVFRKKKNIYIRKYAN